MRKTITMSCLFFILSSSLATSIAHSEEVKFIVAHRGASGYLPEHTLEAKAMAYAQGADYLEQDLVMTKDNHLIVLHGLVLDYVTDVDKKFSSKKREDGHYYAIDFTLDEIRTLRATNWYSYKDNKVNPGFKGRFPVFKSNFRLHTFEEEIEFIQGLNESTGKNVGIFPEIKSPWFHKKEGKDITLAVLEALKKYGYTTKKDNVYLQCFDADELKRIKNVLGPKLGVNVKLDQLIAYTNWNETQYLKDGKWVNYNYDWMLKPQAMKEISSYADAISPDYHMIFDKGVGKKYIDVAGFVKAAHQNNLKIIPFSVLADRLPDFAQSVNDLYGMLYNKANVDGVFTDFPDKAASFLNRHP
ncbi:glycerophosphodiester phosphodiesterase [uncultured Pantoea sp.]|jgi:glycerophosphoryl diester phosphodiesterase|uniref:glycerophosphodiester phosphodiesterase n=1 Tax=Pantoea eucrina TaxID=472693 RepID=UPI00374801B9